ncbi:ribonuclease D [Candidatus Endolissoclinum faulkneri L2]|uniref:Ribonuclease D n=1 Tax=Candidatus Endolissoclinum faulkneri L2 TaxID=1193729 RepID=K7ZDE8_9PROT|nr:ribonuclease D [Candidatus Endolissoclinum faulkneri]AFX99456.1 ribonuclease D [Candidatus Endolissoclinum faulkneri L2]
MKLITDTQTLSAVCERIAKEPYVAIDTEFLRDKTYYSKLCLVQLAGEHDVVAIDTLAPDINPMPLFDLMANHNVLKVFHAARQDTEIFVHLTSQVPVPIFDTQIAGMVCGFGNAVSYDRMVRAITGVTIDKSYRFTDWSRRPLSKQQIDYALDDVIHLRPCYECLSNRLTQTDRLKWLEEEMAILTDISTYIIKPEEYWKRIKTHSNKQNVLVVLRALAAWRELKAQKIDIPRNYILRDNALVSIASQLPTSSAELSCSRFFNQKFANSIIIKEILEVIQTALKSPKNTWPQVIHHQGKTRKRQPIAEMLQVLLKLQCKKHNVAPKLVANADDLAAIAADDTAELPAMKGWRREIFGKAALEVKQGKLAFVFDTTNDRLTLIKVPK